MKKKITKLKTTEDILYELLDGNEDNTSLSSIIGDGQMTVDEIKQAMVDYAKQVLDHAKSQIKVRIKMDGQVSVHRMNYSDINYNADGVLVDVSSRSISELKDKLT